MNTTIAAGCHGVLDEDRGAGGEAAERAERAAGEAVAGAGHREGRRQLGQAKHHAGVHDRHQDGGDQQAAPAALGEAEVPAGEVARDDVRRRRDRPAAPSRPSRPAGCGARGSRPRPCRTPRRGVAGRSSVGSSQSRKARSRDAVPSTCSVMARRALVGRRARTAADDRGVLVVGVGDVLPEQRDGVQQRVDAHPSIGDSRGDRRRAAQLGDRQVQPRVGPPVVGVRGGWPSGRASARGGPPRRA